MILWLFIFGHMLADYPLQGDFLSRGKNHMNPIPGVPWKQCLFAHSIIHGGIVSIIASAFYGFNWLAVFVGVLETLVHASTDNAKCNGDITYNVDQMIHIVCKICYTGMLLIAGPHQV